MALILNQVQHVNSKYESLLHGILKPLSKEVRRFKTGLFL